MGILTTFLYYDTFFIGSWTLVAFASWTVIYDIKQSWFWCGIIVVVAKALEWSLDMVIEAQK